MGKKGTQYETKVANHSLAILVIARAEAVCLTKLAETKKIHIVLLSSEWTD